MTGKTLDLNDVIVPDNLGTHIAERYQTWDTFRQHRKSLWKETQQYIFATDTTHTSNSKLPWSNKTTTPKLCQIRDNLFANYMAAMFPKHKWLVWEGDTVQDEDKEKKDAIESYMQWVVDRQRFTNEIKKVVLDYIDYGDGFIMPEWIDERGEVEDENRVRTGYVGPMLRRISPLDIVFNPTAPDFESTPKIIRSIVSIGEVRQMLEQETLSDEDREKADELWKYIKDLRQHANEYDGEFQVKDDIYEVGGFTSFKEYLQSTYVEVLTFYGDVYDDITDTFLKNYMIVVVDRHKVIIKKPHPTILGHIPIYKVSWRMRPDNLWGMGPLDNLVGMQYRIDHLENMKADVMDLTTYPPLKVRGMVDDFDWAPMERIHIDGDSDVELMAPDSEPMRVNLEIERLEQKMEEMAGSPKEAMGFRTPGEKTKFEVQSLQNASGRIFQSKISSFEIDLTEPGLNAMLEMSRRHMNPTTIRILDDEFKVAMFEDLSAMDITGVGRLRPIAARHFAEQAQKMQNITSFFGSAVGQDPEIKMHFSSEALAFMAEKLLEIEDDGVVKPYIRLTEQQEAQKQMQIQQEEVAMEAQTPIGIAPDDFDPEVDDEFGLEESEIEFEGEIPVDEASQ